MPDTVPTANNQQIPTQGVHKGILSQTLREVLHNNPQAQTIIMQAMHITHEQYQQMLNQTDNNQMMNMTVAEILKNPAVLQAAKQMPLQQGQTYQLDPQQMQALMNNTNTEQIPVQIINQEQTTPPPKQSFFQKMKNLLK